MADIVTKDDLLNKLRAYTSTPDDDNTKYKKIIHDTLLKCPELLYALHETELESELFDDDGNINWDENQNPLGEWDRYFGESANIRPFLFLPDAQLDVKNYICYQVGFDELPRYSTVQKYNEITFTIYVHGQDAVDNRTGVARHDLIASILREKFNWSNIFGRQVHIISNKESTTDNKYIVRAVILQLTDVNSITNTPYNGKTSVMNYQLRR
jgi:hypothetical protein